MKKMTIGTEAYASELGDCLQEAQERLNDQGIRLVGEQFMRDRYTFYTYRLVDRHIRGEVEDSEKAIQTVAEAVAKFVTDVWERRELQKMVASNFYYYSAEEVEYISDAAVKMLSEVSGEDGKPLRHDHIAGIVADQLAESAELLIEGLLRFRMRSLREDLPRVIEQAIDEYLLDLEYQEFVKLLRYFLEAQEPGMSLMHMLCVGDSTIRLFDEEGKPVTVDSSGDDQPKFPIQHVHVEDLLLSSLIALAPQQLVIHQGMLKKAPPLAETVRKIFTDKATFCSDCPLCQTADEWREDNDREVMIPVVIKQRN